MFVCPVAWGVKREERNFSGFAFHIQTQWNLVPKSGGFFNGVQRF